MDEASGGARPATSLSAKNRTEAFSDGVFAIAITLLVIEVRVPGEADIEQAGSLWQALAHAWPSYLSYLATFLTVAVIWLNHHAVFAKIARLDRSLQWWNLLLLLAVAFTPFPNALVAEHLRDGLFTEPARTATAVYALVFTASTVPWLFVWSHLAHRPELLEPGYGADYARAERRRSAVGVIFYGLGVGVAVAVPLGAVLLFLASAVFYGLTAQGSRLDGAEDG